MELRLKRQSDKKGYSGRTVKMSEDLQIFIILSNVYRKILALSSQRNTEQHTTKRKEF